MQKFKDFLKILKYPGQINPKHKNSQKKLKVVYLINISWDGRYYQHRVTEIAAVITTFNVLDMTRFGSVFN